MSALALRAIRMAVVAFTAVGLVALGPAASAQEGFPGTIKVSGVLEPPTPDNQANPGCLARVDYYNFKLGTYDVLFTAMPPSGTREVLRSVVRITQESARGNDVQQSAQYRLNVTGLASDGPGYKLKVEVSDPDKSGQGAKSKVFSFLCVRQAAAAPGSEVLGTRGARDAGTAPVGGFDTGRGGAAAGLPVLPMVAVVVGAAAVGAGAVAGRRRRTA